MGRRELQKQARRATLLQAARAALERGDFSMRRLAEDAGMSEVTPYNLFGSKRGVLEALYVTLRSEAEEQLARLGPRAPLERVFDAIDLLAAGLASAPGFYRGFFGALVERPVSDRPPTGDDPGRAYWRHIIAQAAADGGLRPGARQDLLARSFICLIGGAMQDWLDERITAEEWGLITAHGFALMALPLASKDAAPTLRERLAAAEVRLKPAEPRGADLEGPGGPAA